MSQLRPLYRIGTLSALVVVLTLGACSGTGSQPRPAIGTTAATPPGTSATATLAPSVASTLSPVATAPSPEPVADPNVIYQDDFSDTTTGWPGEKLITTSPAITSRITITSISAARTIKNWSRCLGR
jgi:hypothetical protein